MNWKRVLLVFAWCCAMAGCASMKSECHSARSDTAFIHRTVTLYTCDGKVIKSWEGNMRIGSADSAAIFVDIEEGVGVRRVFINGTFTIEEN